MKLVIVVVGFILLVSAIPIVTAGASVEINSALKVKAVSNATYQDGHSVANMTLIYNPNSNAPYMLFWDEEENYTYKGASYLTHEIMISTSTDFVNWSGSNKDIVVSMEDGADSVTPDAAINDSDGKAYLVWSEKNKTSGFWEIYYGYSPDGINWSSRASNHVISDYESKYVTDCMHPKIAITSDNYVHAVWLGKNTTTDSWELYYGNSPGGNVWSSESRDIPISVEDNYSVQSADITVLDSASPVLWVLWTEYDVSGDSYEVLAANSTYPYTKWNTTIIESTYKENAYNITAVVYNNEIYAFWEQEVKENGKEVREIDGAYFHDGYWDSTVDIISYEDGHNATNPSAGASPQGLFVVWNEYDENSGHEEIMIGNMSSNGWSSANEDIVVTHDTGAPNKDPSIVVGEFNTLYLAWLHWTEESTKQRGFWGGCTMVANTDDVIPELQIPIMAVAAAMLVLLYAGWKRKRA